MTSRGPRRAQLSTRVMAGVLLITLTALAAFDIAAVTAVRKYLVSQTGTQLTSVLSLYRPLEMPGIRSLTARLPARQAAGKQITLRPGQAGIMITGPRLLLRPSILDQYYVEWVTKRGPRAFLEGNPNLQPPGWIATAGNITLNSRTVVGQNGHAQLLVRSIPAPGGTLIATTSLAAVSRTVDRLELIVAIGSAAAALLVGLGVAWVSRRGLRPIETMAAQADRITTGDLTDRVSPQDSRTEVGRLGAALNGMLTRIQSSVDEREVSQELTRRFFADASHELRTPLASLRANAELYQQGALTRRSQVDEAMRRINLEAQRMSRLIDDMLRLARLDQHPSQQDEQVDLTALVTECADRAQIADSRRSWHTDISADLMTAGDEELLRRAIDNILANVHAHTPEDAAASITAARHNGTVTIDVSDDGPGVPASQLPRIFDRFYRAPAPAPRPGSGLGLAIVTAIASAHDGTATAALNEPRGLRITLALPACAPPGAAEQVAAGAAPARRASPRAPLPST
jgi:two-component system, OmpR family, sensor kinase